MSRLYSHVTTVYLLLLFEVLLPTLSAWKLQQHFQIIFIKETCWTFLLVSRSTSTVCYKSKAKQIWNQSGSQPAWLYLVKCLSHWKTLPTTKPHKLVKQPPVCSVLLTCLLPGGSFFCFCTYPWWGLTSHHATVTSKSVADIIMFVFRLKSVYCFALE